MNTKADTDFWTSAEIARPALYLSKLATDMNIKGQGIGALLIYWAANYAHKRGLRCVRWDVWRTNEDLQAYYRSIDAKHLRTCDVPGRNSGALFEQGTGRILRDTTAAQIATTPEFEPQIPLSSVPFAATDQLRNEAAPHGNQLGYEPARTVANWLVKGLDVAPELGAADRALESSTPLTVTEHSEPVLFDPGTGWHLHRGYSSPLVTQWPAELDQADLRTGHVYRVCLTSAGQGVAIFGDSDLWTSR